MSHVRLIALSAFLLAVAPNHADEAPRTEDGYRGIWFSIGQAKKFGAKYSGGLGTYTCSHAPMAVYSETAGKTFFTYGGTDATNKRLILMAGAYDHATNTVPRPTVVRDCGNFSDPHANPSIALDADGYVWIFASQRHALPGQKYRSHKPLDVSAFDLVETKKEFAYGSAWPVPGKGLLLPFTKYTGGRELYFQMLPAGGTEWSKDAMLATQGHYHVSGVSGNKVAIAFNWHPGGDLDKRTNLYYMETADFGRTWKNAAGEELKLPLNSWPKNPALVEDYQTKGKLVYTHDLAFDADGMPVVLFLTSGGSAAGPSSGDRQWTTARWTGKEWIMRLVTTSDHNYDTGCLHVETDGTWRVIGPTAPGPQPPGTGGEIVAWTSDDKGENWKPAPLTAGSVLNHLYARRPKDAHPDFYAFWADGNPERRSESRLYFATKKGEVFRLPHKMTGDSEKPERVPLKK